MCEELLSIEPDAKWPLATQTCLKQLKLEVKSGSKGAAAEGEGESLEATPLAYERLAEIDSMRRGYYMDAAEGKANTIASWASMPKEGAGLQVAQGVTS